MAETVHHELLLIEEQLFLLQEVLYDTHAAIPYGKPASIMIGASATAQDIRRRLKRITDTNITEGIEILEEKPHRVKEA